MLLVPQTIAGTMAISRLKRDTNWCRYKCKYNKGTLTDVDISVNITKGH